MKQYPGDFNSLEDWIVGYLYEWPKTPHTTYSLLRDALGIVESQPSSIDTINALLKASGREDMTPAAAPIEDEKPTFGDVQKSIEDLIEAGTVKGDRNRGVEGVYFEALKLTPKGEAHAIRRKREREKLNTLLESEEFAQRLAEFEKPEETRKA